MKTVPTNTSSTIEKPTITVFIFLPKYIPTISGIEVPSCFIDITPDKWSWTAPANIQPKVIHKNATGPNKAPDIAPNIGPVPAIFKNWIKNTLYHGIGM